MVPTSWASVSSSSSLVDPLVLASTATRSSALLPVRVVLSTACPSLAFPSKPAGRLAMSLRCTISFTWPFPLFLVFPLASSVPRPDFTGVGSSFFLLWTFSLNSTWTWTHIGLCRTSRILLASPASTLFTLKLDANVMAAATVKGKHSQHGQQPVSL
jgi:hypothetical protein